MAKVTVLEYERVVRMVDGQIVSEETLDAGPRGPDDEPAPAGRRRVASPPLTAAKKVDGQIVSEEILEVR